MTLIVLRGEDAQENVWRNNFVWVLVHDLQYLANSRWP